MIKVVEKISMPQPIRIAQFIKNSWGRMRIIWSSYHENIQFSFPGKKIWWNIVNALSKLIDANAPIIMGSAITPIPE